MAQRGAERDLPARIGERLPASPLSLLGGALAALVVVRVAADADPLWEDLLTAALPLSVSLATVAADRSLVHDDVPVRDRMTVFSYALGGFLTAAVITALQLLVTRLDGTAVGEPLFLTLVGGTVGVGAGTVAGAAEIRQRAATRDARRERRRLEEFASVVSHDLRNPLEVARGHLKTAFEEGDITRLTEVMTSLSRMDELIEDSLALARQGTVVEDTAPTDVAAVAEAAWDGVATGDATLSVETDATVRADDSRLRTLFENCFRNSVEHGSTSSRPEADDAIEHGGDDVEVRVEPLERGRGFAIADDGPGVPPDERETVFERGHTTDPEGTGLGLAIVRAIAEAHGWSVAMEESEEGGARVVVRVG